MAVAVSSKYLQLSDIKLTSGSMKHIILKSFGPIGQKTMLISSTGQSVVTRDGVTILSAIHFSHPVAKCVLESVQSFVDTYGDGCKTFIIYLHHLLEAICSDQASQGCWDLSADSAYYRTAVSKCLHEFMSQDFFVLSQELKNFVHIQNEAFNTRGKGFVKQSLACLLKSYFCGGLPSEYVHQLSELLATYIDSVEDKKSFISLALRWFDNFVFSSVDSYSQSHSEAGIFLTGIFSLKFTCGVNMNAILMQCPFEDSNTTGDMISPCQLSENIFTHRTRVTLHFLTRLKQNHVLLLLTPHRVPDYIAQIARELNINIVSCLEDYDFEFLMFATGKVSVSNIWDELDSSCLVPVRSYESVFITGRQYLRILLEHKALCLPDSALFLCAPTDALVKQLKDVVKRSFKVISHCLHSSAFTNASPVHQNPDVHLCTKPDNEKQLKDTHLLFDIIPGGGYFEYLLSHFLNNYILTNTQLTPGRKLCCQLLVKMLLALPEILYQNLSTTSQISQSSAYLSKYSTIQQALTENSVVGFYSSTLVTNPSEHGLWEGLDYKLAAVMEVIQLVENLLRVDSVIGVKKLSGAKLNHTDSENEDGYDQS